MGAEAFAALGDAKVVGLAGISLAEYAACLGGQLSAQCTGIALGVQVIHRAEVQELLADLADASQPRFSELARQDAHKGAVIATCITAQIAAGSTLTRALVALSDKQRRGYATEAVLRTVHALTGASSPELSSDTPLMEAGVDSLAATELATRLRNLSGVALSPTLMFEQPSPRAIASHLVDQLAEAGQLVTPVARAGASPTPQQLPSVYVASCTSSGTKRWALQPECGHLSGALRQPSPRRSGR